MNDEVKKEPTPTPAATPQDTQAAPSMAPPADAGPKKRGPKPGSKNIPKPGVVPKPRKTPDAITDTRTAAQRRLEETRKILERHDKEHGTKTAAALPSWDSIATGAPPPPPPPQMAPEVVAAGLQIVFNLLGEALDVESRPAPASIATAAASISQLSAFLPVMSPVQVAALASVAALVACGAPMVAEYRQVKAGEKQPASKRGKAIAE